MRTYTPTDKWITPPENQGQMVLFSYNLDSDAEVILVSIRNLSERTQEYHAYEHPVNDSGDWTPWCRAPRLGQSLGACDIATNPRPR